MIVIPFIVVFIATLLCDFAWTKYNLWSAAKDAHRAAAWSAAIIVFGTINVISYTANHWLVLPALLGAYIGTYVAIWWEKRANEPASEPASDYCDELGCECGGYMRPPKPMSAAYEGPAYNVPAGTCDHPRTAIADKATGVTRWSCGCPTRLSGTMPRVKPRNCDHERCHVVIACEGVVRWSCGSIEG